VASRALWPGIIIFCAWIGLLAMAAGLMAARLERTGR
jgi:hypothetical protein